jgi:hypothetical protein
VNVAAGSLAYKQVRLIERYVTDTTGIPIGAAAQLGLGRPRRRAGPPLLGITL